jgi:5,10-methylenetetrahydromethanopterin reductase
MRWDDVRQYVRTVRALLRGEDAIWNEKPVRMAQPAGFAAARPADVSVLIAADGQKGRAVAAELGDGVLSARVPDVLADAAGAGTGQHRMVVLTFGTVLGDDEEATSPRAIAAAGPALAAAYHAIYESRGPAGVDRLPGGLEWRDAIEAVDQEHRHLAIHEGHLAVLSGHDETLVAMAASLLPKWTVTGTAVEVRARLAKLPAAGVSEIAYQPMGPDIARELTAFAEAAGLRVTERQVAQPKTTATGGGLE